MNRRILSAVATALLLLGGCNSKSSPAPHGPSETSPAWSKYDLGGGRYLFEIEVTRPFSSSINFRFRDQGNTNLEEFVDLSVGEAIKLRIDDGRLTVNGTGRGEVKHGDRIKVHASGRVSVNDVDR